MEGRTQSRRDTSEVKLPLVIEAFFIQALLEFSLYFIHSGLEGRDDLLDLLGVVLIAAARQVADDLDLLEGAVDAGLDEPFEFVRFGFLLIIAHRYLPGRMRIIIPFPEWQV
jgi:hypothetical protein